MIYIKTHKVSPNKFLLEIAFTLQTLFSFNMAPSSGKKVFLGKTIVL